MLQQRNVLFQVKFKTMREDLGEKYLYIAFALTFQVN